LCIKFPNWGGVKGEFFSEMVSILRLRRGGGRRAATAREVRPTSVPELEPHAPFLSAGFDELLTVRYILSLILNLRRWF
jgi:hypothetical protein